MRLPAGVCLVQSATAFAAATLAAIAIAAAAVADAADAAFPQAASYLALVCGDRGYAP